MKNIRALFFVFIFVFISVIANAQSALVTINANNIEFQKFCNQLSEQSGVAIYFNDEVLQKTKVNVNVKNVSLKTALSKAVDTLYFQVLNWNNAIIISKKDVVPLSVVQYSYEQVAGEIDSVTPKEKKYYKTSKAGVLQKIIVGKKGSRIATKRVLIVAKIVENGNNGIIPGATIYVKSLQKGAVADKDGYASLSIMPGKYTLVAKSVGMKTQEYNLIVYNEGVFDVLLHTQSVELSSIKVYGDRQMSMMNRDPGIEKVSSKTLKKLPVMVGEPDVIKASAMLPGIVSVGEGTSGLNVRGGSSDQNAFYINSIPVFNTSHMLGFFPAFNADLIRSFTIYKGYIPAKYGGKLSSVFDVETRKGNRRKFSLHGGVSPMAANMVTSIPIIKDTLSVILSARKSFSNWILRKVDDKTINKSSVEFSDFSYGIYYDLPKTQVSVFGYHSYDYFAFSDLNEYQYSTDGLSLQMGQFYGKKLRANYSLVASRYKFETKDYIEPSKAYAHAYEILQNELKADFTYTINKNHSLKLGINSIFYGLARGQVLPISESKISPVDMGNEKGIENAIYLTDVWSPFEWLELNTGFRYTMYNLLGPNQSYKYIDGQMIDEGFIEDTLHFANNEVVTTNHFPEFRFAANIIASKKSNIKLAFTQTHQSLFMLNTMATVSPSSQWKLADYHIKPSKSEQYSIGYYREITRFGMEASIETYFKNTNNFTEFRDGADFLGNKNVELSVLQGKQRSYGVELMLRRRGEYRFTGWLAYTYSRSMIEIDGDTKWQKINNGNPYPSSFDIPHSVNLFLNIKLSKRVNFSTTVNYQTGRPITFPISMYYIDDLSYVDYSERNSYRIPYYFRVDASLTVEGNLKRDKFLHSSFVFSVYNLTGRDNPYSVYFTTEAKGIKAHQYSVIAIPVVTATWVFKFGNFDAN